MFTQPAYSCATAGKVWQFTAYLNDRAGGLKVTLVIAATGAAGEKPIDQVDLTMTSPETIRFDDGPLDVGLFCGDPFGPGTYVARIVRPSDSKVLAEGTFAITQ